MGSVSQVADARSMNFEDGKARGMRCIQVMTGSGLEFTILPDRCLDICWAQYQGYPISYISKSEVCGSEFFLENGDKGFLDNFFGGLLTTSGLSNVGAANEDEGVQYGLHGTISNTPASNVAIEKLWEGDEYRIKIRGTVRQSRFYGEDLVLRRTITTHMGSKTFTIEDEIENQGFKPQPLMILYHLNFGFPFVSEASKLFMNESQVTPRTSIAAKGLHDYAVMTEPVHGYQEQCFYHDFCVDDTDQVKVGLFNPNLGANGLGIYLEYQKQDLPCFCQWKQMGEQEYVMGLIPSNAFAEGRHIERQNHGIEMLNPQETKKICITVGITDLGRG
jgi:hypothetical protein